jgi:hypothetical protein
MKRRDEEMQDHSPSGEAFIRIDYSSCVGEISMVLRSITLANVGHLPGSGNPDETRPRYFGSGAFFCGRASGQAGAAAAIVVPPTLTHVRGDKVEAGPIRMAWERPLRRFRYGLPEELIVQAYIFGARGRVSMRGGVAAHARPRCDREAVRRTRGTRYGPPACGSLSQSRAGL